MKLQELQKEMIKAMKDGDMDRKSVLSNAIAAIKKAAIDKRIREDIPEDLVDEVLLKEKKTIQEMIDTCPADREETLAEYHVKMTIISEYAPTLLTDENEIKEKILSIINDKIELTKNHRGLIMRQIAPELKGKADMSIVNKVLSTLLI